MTSANNRRTARPSARTQAERSAHTRGRLLEVAVDSLYRHGYSATTTMLVAERAGLSRGTMLYHFPTKADLMTFVVQSVYEEEVGWYEEAVAGITSYEDLVLALTDAAWKILSRPSGVAVLEIMLGARSDESLAARLHPLQAKIEANSRYRLRHMLGRHESLDLVRLIVWSIRGLSIGKVLIDPESMARCVALLQHFIRAGLDAGVLAKENDAKGRGKAKSAAARRGTAQDRR